MRFGRFLPVKRGLKIDRNFANVTTLARVNSVNAMFADYEEQKAYIKENYPEVTDSRLNDAHWDLHCTNCNVVRGFQVIHRWYTTQQAQYSAAFSIDYNSPRVIYFQCPVCRTYKLWVLFRVADNEVDANGKEQYVERLYRVTSIPSEGIEDIDELPEEPKALRIAYKQAIRAMDANAHIAAAAMFRRALQVITREILKVERGNLANELRLAVGMKYNGATITKDFSDIAYIIKEVGNQGAHPDEDPDLLDFTPKDAEDLQKIFMELVSDLFVVPEVVKKAKADFMQRRKINQTP